MFKTAHALSACALILVVASSVRADDAEETKSIDTALAAYVEAYNAKDIDALGAVWGADSDFVDHRGRRYAGRDEIMALFRKALVDSPGYTIKLDVKSRKFLRPDLAVDDGVLELTEPSGEVESGRYVTIWAKQDGRWFMQSVRDMPSDPETKAEGQNPMADLQFLVGDWVNESEDVRLKCDWKSPGKFLLQEYEFGAADPKFTVTVLIGWDPAARKVRSWFFDSSGGFGDGAWQAADNMWQVADLGVLPDGRASTSITQWQQIDNDTLVWRATRREVEGEAVPDAEVKFVRRK